MRRVVAFFRWQETQWRSRVAPTGAQPQPGPIQEGKAAYALRQADIRYRLHTHFDEKWRLWSPQLIQMEGRDAYEMVECH